MTSGDTTTYHYLTATLLGLAIVLSTACSSAPKRVEADYGSSVNQMVQAATYNPEAAASTESIPVLGMDGRRSMRTLDAMQRTSQERPKDFNDVFDIQLDVD